MYIDPGSMQIQTIVVVCGIPFLVVSGVATMIYFAIKAGVKAGINASKQTKKQ